MLLDVGRVCIKTMGHEANEKCVVLDNAGENFVIVAGPRVKKRKCNIKHLEILPHKINVKKDSSEKEIIDSLLKAGLISEQELSRKPDGYAPKPRGAERKAEPKAETKSAQKPKKEAKSKK